MCVLMEAIPNSQKKSRGRDDCRIREAAGFNLGGAAYYDMLALAGLEKLLLLPLSASRTPETLVGRKSPLEYYFRRAPRRYEVINVHVLHVWNGKRGGESEQHDFYLPSPSLLRLPPPAQLHRRPSCAR